MNLERELKFICSDVRETEQKIYELGGKRLASWYFEKNLVLDDAEGRLWAGNRLLRLRRAGERSKLTLKSPASSEADPNLKVWREMEVELGDMDSMLSIFSSLGLSVSWHYEKFRSKWMLSSCVVCLDILPFGRFLELEGDKEAIHECAKYLDLDLEQGSKKSYYELYREIYFPEGLSTFQGFVFDAGEKLNIAGELELVVDY